MSCWGGSTGPAGACRRFRLRCGLLLAFSPRLLTREPISAGCDVSPFFFPPGASVETFNSFHTGRGTHDVQAWKKIHKFGGLRLFPWIFFFASDLKISLEKRRKKKVSRPSDGETNFLHLD